jgi:hypothetical protein
MSSKVKSLLTSTALLLVGILLLWATDLAFTGVVHHGLFVNNFYYRLFFATGQILCAILWICSVVHALNNNRILQKAIVFLFIGSLPLALIAGRAKAKTDLWYAGLKGTLTLDNSKLFTADTLLGYRMIPGARAENALPYRKDHTAVIIGPDGFRVASGAGVLDTAKRPLLLFLGDSFTYGACCTAEQSFAYRCARQLDASYIDAGAGGYGLAQMLLLAGSLIPRYRPDAVIVQRSPWLLQRSMSPFAPSHFGTLPVPYIAKKGTYYLACPIRYRMDPLNLPLLYFQKTKKSLGDYLRFALTIGIPLTIADDIDGARTLIGMASGSIPRPAASGPDVERFAFSSIDSLCKSYGARMVTLDLAFANKARMQPIPGDQVAPLIANADSLLLERLGDS